MVRLFDIFTEVTPAKEMLTADDVRRIVEERFAAEGKTELKVAAITARDENAFTVELVTKEGAPVKTLLVDRRTGGWETA